MKVSPQKIQAFQHTIFSWWKINRRDLPWRKTHDPYKILVSEVMLQQTQVSRVLPTYQAFLLRFPDAQALASSPVADVLKMWKGLGYNRRALYLKKTAEAVMSQYGGIFPSDEALLLQLPGVGKYTARAIQIFAYKKHVAAVDTNIRQIIVHFFFEGQSQSEKIIQDVADVVVPKGKSWEWHQALMDYGAIELTKKKRIKNTLQGIQKKKTIPFKETNRFYRGKIMDVLREKSVKELALIDDFVRQYDRSEAFMDLILDGLEKDNLIVRKRGLVSLPE
jgi:A/G-specific adenine glycosylase